MHLSNPTREPYKGKTRQLVVAIDIGTTFTAASFCILQPGFPPKFEEIMRWPKQVTPDAKVPSVIMYNSAGRPRIYGAEVDDDETIVNEDDEALQKAEWWKLHLRPAHLPTIDNLNLPSLPDGVTVDDTFAHFLGYVKQQIENYVLSQYANGRVLWATLTSSMHVVLSTPNGWEGRQQQRMRLAAIQAGLVDADGGRRVKFVTEAEAATLFAIDSGCIGDWLVDDGRLILCDCGGGTVDITGYKIISTKPLRMVEIAASRCYLAGAVFVTKAAEKYFKETLQGSEWDDEDSLERILQHFEMSAKRKFEGSEAPSWVQMGTHKSHPLLGIVRGRLRIPGATMEAFFAPSIKSIRDGLDAAVESGGQFADKIILVGGLSASPYVYAEICKWGDARGISVSRPDGVLSKAVAHGALAWYIDNSVTARYSKWHYGITVAIAARSQSPSELRGRRVWRNRRGQTRVSGAWSSILAKGVEVDADKEFHGTFSLEQPEWTVDHEVEAKVYACRRAQPPKFVMMPDGRNITPGFEKLCKISADLHESFRAAPVMTGVDGEAYRDISFDVCLRLGGTELEARIRWLNNGTHEYGTATVAYD